MGKPFLKWVGGKTYLIPDIVKLLPEKIKTYYEPMVGGGALFFHLADKGLIKTGIISDINSELINTYETVRNKLDQLILLLTQLENEYLDARDQEAHYMRVREHIPRELSRIERAARFIYLNKTCFNGLYRVNKQNKFNVPFGRRPKPKICDTETLQKANKLLQNAEIIRCPASKMLEIMNPNDVAYIDPPYWPVSETSFVSYTENGFGSDDQKKLAKQIVQLVNNGVYIVASNSDVPPVRELYKGMNIRQVEVPRRVNANGKGRGKVPELLIYPKEKL